MKDETTIIAMNPEDYMNRILSSGTDIVTATFDIIIE